jgi:hypothetical protein
MVIAETWREVHTDMYIGTHSACKNEKPVLAEKR